MPLTKRCQHCGYELSHAAPDTGEPRCPECGTLYLIGMHPAPEWPGLTRALLDACGPFFLLFGVIALLTTLTGFGAFACLSSLYSIPLFALGVIVPIKVARRCALRFPISELPWASQRRVAVLAIAINASAMVIVLAAVLFFTN
jgi:hypothetical protein